MVTMLRRFISQPLSDVFNKFLAGIIVAFMVMMLSFSLASLIFAGALAPYLSQGVGILIVSSIIGLIVMGIFASQYRIIPAMQSSLILIIAAMTTNLVVANGKDIFTTTLVLLPITALSVGIAFFVLGYFRLVKFIRYIPYPVIGGFLAGNGVLLIVGAMEVMLPFELTISNLSQLFAVDNLIIWLPGVIIATILFASLRLVNQYLMIPLVIALGVVGVYGWMSLQGTSVTAAGQSGLLLGDIGSIAYQLPLILDFDLVDWRAIQSQWANIVTIVMVASIHLPLNLAGIELIKQDDLDIDEQVRYNGIMNIIIGLAGGNVGFSSASISTMNHRIGGDSRLVYVVAIIALSVVLWLGSEVLMFVPIAILGGLLMYIGFDFIDTWILQGLDKFTRTEYVVAILIMITVIFLGFLEGVVLGTFVMLLVFVATYSQISTIHRSVSAKNIPSTVERSPHFMDELFKLRDQAYILELTNFLFFGTAESIVNEARKRLTDESMPTLKFLIIDFRRVAGVDSSALLSLNKIIKLAESNEFRVIFSDFEDNPAILRIMADLSSSECLEFAPTLDHAIEQSETILLEDSGTTQAFVSSVIWMQLRDMGMDKKYAKEMAKYMARKQYLSETILIKQGDFADTIYFVEIGQVSIFLDFETDQPIRLRSIGMGSVVGEIGFFLEQERSATVVSDMHSYIYELKKEVLEQLKEENPELAFAFEAMMLKVVAKRLTTNNQLLSVLR